MGPDAQSLIERARRDGPSTAQREQMRRNVKAALVAGLGVAGTSTAVAAHVGAAVAAHGLGASLTPLGVLGWLGAGSAVSAVVLGAVVLATGKPTATTTPPGPAAAPAAAVMAAFAGCAPVAGACVERGSATSYPHARKGPAQ